MTRSMNNELTRDVAHIHHAELLTPTPQESLEFFTDLFGMQIESRSGQSVFLRGWGETQPYGLKLTESALPGLGQHDLNAPTVVVAGAALHQGVSFQAVDETGQRALAQVHGLGKLLRAALALRALDKTVEHLEVADAETVPLA